jgi:hypothetical protein
VAESEREELNGSCRASGELRDGVGRSSGALLLRADAVESRVRDKLEVLAFEQSSEKFDDFTPRDRVGCFERYPSTVDGAKDDRMVEVFGECLDRGADVGINQSDRHAIVARGDR